jgi:chemotaxis protein CheY-P-specific phosphatase CheC/chemotaxis signal transduction protein
MMINNEANEEDRTLTLSEDMDLRYIIFQLNSELLSIPLKFVQEVVDLKEIRKLPRISENFYGVYDLRGEIIPIVNFAKLLFGVSARIELTGKNVYHTVILHLNNETLGIIVDDIEDISVILPDQFKNLPSAIKTKVPLTYIENIANIDGIIVKVLDIMKIIAEKSLMQTSEAVQVDKLPPSKKAGTQPTTPKKKLNKTESMLKMDKNQLDAVREISNIASGKAVMAMSKLFKTPTKISINVEEVMIKNIADYHQGAVINLSERVLGVRSLVKEDLDAGIFLILQLKDVPFLLKEIDYVEKPPIVVESLKDLDKASQSALNEFCNIIISHYCAGISDFLKIQLYHDVPETAIDEYGALLDGEFAKIAEYSEQGLFLKTQILTQTRSIAGEIIFIPYYDSIRKFVDWLDVDEIVKMLEDEAQGAPVADLQKAQLEKSTGSKAPIKTTTPAKSTTPTAPVKASTTAAPAKTSAAPAKTTTTASTAAPAKSTAPAKSSIPAPAPEKVQSGSSAGDVFNLVQSQKEFHLDDKDKTDLHIDESSLDAFRELGNIGAGNAGNALSQMLNKKVYLEIPPAKVLKLTELVQSYGSVDNLMVGYIGLTKGFLETNIILTFQTDHIENLLQIVMESDTKKAIKKESDLNETEKSAVIEMLNILLGHYIAALTDFLKVKIEPPEYQFFFKRNKQLFQQLEAAEKGDVKAIIIETNIKVDDVAPIRGQFILLLHPKMIKKVIDRMTEIW